MFIPQVCRNRKRTRPHHCGNEKKRRQNRANSPPGFPSCCFFPFLRVLEQGGGPFFITALFIIAGYPSLDGDLFLYFEIIVRLAPDITVIGRFRLFDQLQHSLLILGNILVILTHQRFKHVRTACVSPHGFPVQSRHPGCIPIFHQEIRLPPDGGGSQVAAPFVRCLLQLFQVAGHIALVGGSPLHGENIFILHPRGHGR